MAVPEARDLDLQVALKPYRLVMTMTDGGHDAWVVGDEPAVFVEFQGAANYAKPS